MIKIEKINNNGVVSLNEVDYTVETNFKPKISPNSFLFNNYCVDVEDDGFYCENNHKGNSTHDGYCAFTQQVFKPFECGSLVLKNKSIHSLGAIDILESNNKSNPEGVLAVADISLGWFNTTDSFRGTHNPAESYTKYTENGIEINSVFEFHEKSSVGEINEIELYSKPINVPSESNARNALASRGATDFSSGSMSFIDPKCSMQLTQSGYNVNPYTTNVHFDGEGNLYRYFSNVSGEVLQVKLVDGSEFFVKDCLSNIKKLTSNGVSLNYSYQHLYLLQFNGVVYFVLNKGATYKGAGRFDYIRYLVPITNIIAPNEEKPNGEVEVGTPIEFCFKNQGETPMGWVSAGSLPSMTASYTLSLALTLNDKHYFVITDSNRKVFAFVEITEDFGIVKSHKAIRFDNVSTSTYGEVKVFPYYDDKSGDFYISISSDYDNTSSGYIVLNTYKVDSSLESATKLTKNFNPNLINSFIKYPNDDKIYTYMNYGSPTLHEFKQGNNSIVRNYYFGEMINTTAKPLIKIKLNSPLTKAEGEILKLSLNINLEE